MTQQANVVHVLEATTGGTRRHLVDLVSHLDADRFSVSVICSVLRDPAFLQDVDDLRKRGIAVDTVPMRRSIRPLADTIAFAQLAKRLARGCDIVHTHSSKAGFLGRLAAHRKGVPVLVHTPHVFPFQMRTGSLARRLYILLERLAARWTDVLICVSEEEREAARALRLLPEEKLVLIENGIALPPESAVADASAMRCELGIPEGCTVVGTVGRCVRQKGHEYLIRAAADIVKQGRDAVFIILGDGEWRKREEALARDLGLGPKLRFLNPRDNLDPFFAMLDVFVLPSLWEGLPYALLEAMSARNAVVATTVGGCGQAVTDGTCGLLVPPGDAHALADAIDRLLQDDDLRSRLGVSAQETVQARFLLADMVARVEKVYDAALEKRARERYE